MAARLAFALAIQFRLLCFKRIFAAARATFAGLTALVETG